MASLLGIDLGTSSVKCALVDADSLDIIHRTSQEYTLYYPQDTYVEQAPHEWWDATLRAVADLMQSYSGSDIIGIGFSRQMHGTVLLGENATLLHPAIIWADQRSKDVLSELLDIPDYVAITGTGPAVGFMGTTLRWLQRHRAELLAQVKHVVLPKDYIRYRMTGEIATDVSDAASTGLFDIRQAKWSETIIRALGLPGDIFPKVVQAYDIVGELTQGAAAELGLSAGIPIVAGCADQAAQAIGNGILSAGRLSITLGSGGQIFVPLKNDASALKTDARIHVFNHATGGYYALGAILSAGLALRCLRDWLGLSQDDSAYAKLEQSAENIAAGADRLLFLPYLNGTRTPHMNPSARGAFIGLTSRHTQGHLVRSVLEGVAFAIRQAYEVCTALTPTEAKVIIGAGGGMNSNLWRQITVDVLNHPIVRSPRTEQASLGAAILAGIGLNRYGDTFASNLSYLDMMLANDDTISEPTAHHLLYDERYQLFKACYPLLN